MGSVVKKVSGSLFGGGGSPGALGTGRFQASTVNVDKDPFKKKLAGAGNQEELRKRQLAQTDRQEAAATGAAPSIAEAELKSATNRSLAQQLAAAKSGRGGSAASRERQLAKGQATARRDISEQASTAKLKERQLAEQALATQLQAQRAQDIGLAESDRASEQALQDLLVKQNLGAQGLNLSGYQSAAQNRSGMAQGMMQGAASLFGMSDENNKTCITDESEKKKKKLPIAEIANKSKNKSDVEIPEAPKPPAAKEKKGMDIAAIVKMAGPALAAMSDENNKIMTKEERVKWNKSQAKKGIELAGKRRSSEKRKALGEKIGKAGSAFKKGFENAKKPINKTGANMANRMAQEISSRKSAKAYSDENCKEKIEDFNPKSFLDALKPYSYEYKEEHKKNPMAGSGRHLSCMAQDIEKAGPVGRSMVKEGPDGKFVDYGKGFGAILAAQAHLNERLSDLEKKKK